MTKTSKPLVVAPDLVKELQRLAVNESEDLQAYEKARSRYEQATYQALSSRSEFASALYKFTLAYAETPQLIQDKLKDLKIQFKSTSDYYNHISRIAFKNVEEGDAKRKRESYYAELMRLAHAAGCTDKVFTKLVAKGVEKAIQRLREQLGKPLHTPSLKTAREIASKFMNEETFELPGATLAEDVAEGSELQLLARYEKGKITVYGVIPPHLSNTEAVLTKLIASTTKQHKSKYDLLRELLAVIKLVTKVSDEKATASYKIKDGKCHFVVAGKTGTAALIATSDFDLFGRNITLPVAHWSRLISTLMPLRKHIVRIDASDTEIVVSIDEVTIPDIHKWVQDKEHVLTAGKASGSTLLFELTGNNEHLEEPTGRWEPLGSVKADSVEHVFKFKSNKKYTTIAFNDGALKFGSLARLGDSQMHLSKSSYRQLKTACKKMTGLADELRFEKRKNQLRIAADIDESITMSAFVGIE